MVAVPISLAVILPPLTEAISGFSEEKVIAPALPSLTEAVSVAVWPAPSVSSEADRETEVGAAMTVSVEVAFLPLWVLTVMVAVPSPTAVTTPASVTVATVSSLEVKVTPAAVPEVRVYL